MSELSPCQIRTRIGSESDVTLVIYSSWLPGFADLPPSPPHRTLCKLPLLFWPTSRAPETTYSILRSNATDKIFLSTLVYFFNKIIVPTVQGWQCRELLQEKKNKSSTPTAWPEDIHSGECQDPRFPALQIDDRCNSPLLPLHLNANINRFRAFAEITDFVVRLERADSFN